MRPKRQIYFFIGCLILTMALVAAKPVENIRSTHCYALLGPVDESGNSKILESGCYNTFSESMAAATGGRVQLSTSTLPVDVTNSILNDMLTASPQATQVVIGIDWENTSFGGSSFTWAVSSGGCSSTVQYAVSTMPSGWDNRVSSARAYSSCNYYHHYQNTSYGGSSITCNTFCSSMGSLDNATSSERWTYSP